MQTAKRYENWEFSIAGVIGLGVAVDYALDWGMDAIHQRVTGLDGTLRASLEAADTKLGKKSPQNCADDGARGPAADDEVAWL